MATPSFAQTELARALSEQTFGIKSYEITSNAVLESTAEVVTLEGAKITLILSTRGYQVRPTDPRGMVYETIEDVLLAISPEYAQARQRVLMDKLFALAVLRDESED